MAKTNYAYEKRQRELERKRRKEDKAQRRAAVPGAGDAPRIEPVSEAASSPTPEPASLA